MAQVSVQEARPPKGPSRVDGLGALMSPGGGTARVPQGIMGHGPQYNNISYLLNQIIYAEIFPYAVFLLILHIPYLSVIFLILLHTHLVRQYRYLM